MRRIFGVVVVVAAVFAGVAPAVAQGAAQSGGVTQGLAIEPAAASVAQDQTPASPRPPRRPPAAYSKTGYIDSAVVGSYARIRFDIGLGMVGADRGEFFYGKCGCYREVGLDILAPGPSPALNGADPATTVFLETGLDYRDVWFSGEYQLSERFSGFAEAVIRNLSPEVNAKATGVGDLTVGFKGAILHDAERWLTFQLKAILPTGNALKGLGTSNTSWEPGLLYFQQINPRTTLAGEFRMTFPVGGSSDAGVPELSGGTLGGGSFSGNVIRYGIGGSYDVNPDDSIVISPVLEIVGWSVVGGYRTTTVDGTGATAGVQEADATIVNLKLGGRFSFAEYPGSLYIGWGTALTSTHWYENIIRFEYRYSFF